MLLRGIVCSFSSWLIVERLFLSLSSMCSGSSQLVSRGGSGAIVNHRGVRNVVNVAPVQAVS